MQQSHRPSSAPPMGSPKDRAPDIRMRRQLEGRAGRRDRPARMLCGLRPAPFASTIPARYFLALERVTSVNDECRVLEQGARIGAPASDILRMSMFASSASHRNHRVAQLRKSIFCSGPGWYWVAGPQGAPQQAVIASADSFEGAMREIEETGRCR